jgi:NADH dehydrogenase [ubiquinone] 1 alpha subcomplex assembly factor 1
MLRSKIRTIGFALLGNNRTDDGSLASSTSESEAKRVGAGGWGRGKDEEVEVDSELEELMRSDQPSSPQAERPRTPNRPSSGKYHTLNAQSVADDIDLGTPEETGSDTVQVDSEGYYELCIKSVEAVRWDPETE